MNIQVLYYSKTGKTKKVAVAIASALNVHEQNIRDTKLDEGSFVFLGSGCYGGKPGKDMMNFIMNNDFTTRNVALFGTSGSGEGKEVTEMEESLNSKGANIIDRFFCKGKFLLVNRGRPNAEDLEGAKEFARNAISAYE